MLNKPHKHTKLTREHMLNVNQSLIHVISASSVLIMHHTSFVMPPVYVCVSVCVWVNSILSQAKLLSNLIMQSLHAEGKE